MAETAKLLARLTLDKSKYDQGMDAATKKATHGLGKAGALAGKAVKAGMVASAAGAAALTGAMSHAINRAQEYNKQFSNINSILQLSNKEAAALKNELIDFAATEA